MLWDYIVVGGGLAGSVLTNRLADLDPSLKILVIEAGPNANQDGSIVWSNSTNNIGGAYDWNRTTVAQRNLDGRVLDLPLGRALGGGTVINSAGWIRGHTVDYDEWAAVVGDARWGYEGQLPYMRATEAHWGRGGRVNPDQHGWDGPVALQSAVSTNRSYPLRQRALESWEELGLSALPFLDANGGNPLGVGDMNENRDRGRRQIASAVFPLDRRWGITVMTETVVQKVILETVMSENDGTEVVVAKGVQLANGTQLFARETILSAGAVHTPQILMLSGIGPAEKLSKHGINAIINQSAVGQNFMDHPSTLLFWKVRNPEDGWAIGSPNPIFNQPQYDWGLATDFLVTTSVPREGLARAIAADEGREPRDWDAHPLLRQDRAFAEHIFNYGGSTDGSVIMLGLVGLLPTSRGSVGLVSADVRDAPLVDPNYLATEVDRYVFREGLKLQVRFASGDETIIGREGILDGEVTMDDEVVPLSLESTDEQIDERVRQGVVSCFHPMGTCSMGKVVDADLRVKGVRGLRVVDTSVFPVPITAHLQVATYALAQQAAVIIFDSRDK